MNMQSNVEAAATGNQRKALEVLRDTLAAQLDTTDAAIHAQLAAQYRATLADLAALTDASKGSSADDAASRIALRLVNSDAV
jgi:hypothetical protein